MKTKILLLLILLSMFTACNTGYKMSREVRDAPYIYVDFEKFKEGRPCADVRFECLPESQDKVWQEEPLADGLDVFELNSQTMEKFDEMITEWNRRYEVYDSKPHPKGEKRPMLETDLEDAFFERVRAKQFLVEMEESLEKEFPGFWKNTSKKVRYRWMRRAMSKAKKFGYREKQNNQMIELCARIGLDFDLNPKWNMITKFIIEKEDNIGTANDYLDFTVFESDYSLQTGDKLTDWYLKEAFPGLPYPKRPIPKLND